VSLEWAQASCTSPNSLGVRLGLPSLSPMSVFVGSIFEEFYESIFLLPILRPHINKKKSEKKKG